MLGTYSIKKDNPYSTTLTLRYQVAINLAVAVQYFTVGVPFFSNSSSC